MNFKIVIITYHPNPKSEREDVFTEWESENDVNSAELPRYMLTNAPQDYLPEFSCEQQSCVKIQNFVVVRFSTKNCEYRDVAVFNNVDDKENNLRMVTLQVMWELKLTIGI